MILLGKPPPEARIAATSFFEDVSFQTDSGQRTFSVQMVHRATTRLHLAKAFSKEAEKTTPKESLNARTGCTIRMSVCTLGGSSQDL